jgi:hypothetical protein
MYTIVSAEVAMGLFSFCLDKCAAARRQRALRSAPAAVAAMPPVAMSGRCHLPDWSPPRHPWTSRPPRRAVARSQMRKKKYGRSVEMTHIPRFVAGAEFLHPVPPASSLCPDAVRPLSIYLDSGK